MRSQCAWIARVPASKAQGFACLAATRGRGLEHAPVVEDARHVHDLPRPLGDPEHQVPVLGALELGVEAADLLDQVAAEDAEVAGVHLRPHPLRRPVGLEERRLVAAAAVDLVFVGVEVVGFGVGGQRRVDVGQRVGMQRVVVVEQGDELALGHRQRVVGGGDDAAVGLAREQADAGVAALRLGEHLRARAARVEQSSTRHSSQFAKRCRRTEFSIAARTSAGVS